MCRFFLDTLPCNVNNLPILIIRKQGTVNTRKDFQVRRTKVLCALKWLQSNNPCYKDITIDYLQLLPEDDIPSNLLSIDEQEEPVDPHVAHFDNPLTDEGNNHDSHSFLPLPTRQAREAEAIQATLCDNPSTSPLTWPEIGGEPINEFRTPFLATMSFPTLFSHGNRDPCNPGRPRSVPLTDAFKHLEKYGEITVDNVPYWRFASHPCFPYWALNMKQRHQLFSQARVYLQHHPGDASLSVDDLKKMVDRCQAHQCCKSARFCSILVSTTPETSSTFGAERTTYIFLDCQFSRQLLA